MKRKRSFYSKHLSDYVVLTIAEAEMRLCACSQNPADSLKRRIARGSLQVVQIGEGPRGGPFVLGVLVPIETLLK